jgi:hypothetical protein
MILGGARCQCAVCGNRFTRARWFDRHRVGPYTDRWCLSGFAMETLGMVQREEGHWGGPRMPLEALATRRQAVQAAERRRRGR